MQTEYKNLPFEIKAADDSGEFSGLAAAALNVDSTGDVIVPGAFKQDLDSFLSAGFVGGLNHDWDDPIGRPVECREEPGGLFLKARISDTTHGRDCRVLMRDGVVKALSIGYQALGSRRIDDPAELQSLWDSYQYTPSEVDRERSAAGVRLLTRLKLFEVSPVTVPANERAVITGAKQAPESGLSFAADLASVESAVRKVSSRAKARHAARVKEGRSFSSSHLKRIRSAIDAARSFAEELESMILDAEPKPAEPPKAADPPSTSKYDLARTLYIEHQRQVLLRRMSMR